MNRLQRIFGKGLINQFLLYIVVKFIIVCLFIGYMADWISLFALLLSLFLITDLLVTVYFMWKFEEKLKENKH
jgi:hypothetical protein